MTTEVKTLDDYVPPEKVNKVRSLDDTFSEVNEVWNGRMNEVIQRFNELALDYGVSKTYRHSEDFLLPLQQMGPKQLEYLKQRIVESGFEITEQGPASWIIKANFLAKTGETFLGPLIEHDDESSSAGDDSDTDSEFESDEETPQEE